MLQLARPFSLRQVYSLLPRFAAKFAATEFRVSRVTANSAVIQWHAASDLAQLPRRASAVPRLQLSVYSGHVSPASRNPLRLPLASIRGASLLVERRPVL